MLFSLRKVAQALCTLTVLPGSTNARQTYLGLNSDSPRNTLSQSPFTSSRSQASYANAKFDLGDEGIASFRPPLNAMNDLGALEFTSLLHPAFPRHSVRIKKSQFCDETVNSYTGYIDIEARHIFFYFFESRSDPDKDDVIFWTNGGPGCSSSLGLFMELGPCRMNGDNATTHFNESWNTNANLFFIDQPIGVGFSFAEYGEEVSTTEEAARDVAAFVSIFFENFSQFKGRGFHMAGESYGGRYIPLFASAVYDQNAELVKAGMTPINLKSAIIGNGLVDTITMLPSYYDMVCTAASVPAFVDISTCVRMRQAVKRCEKWLKKSCVDHFDGMDCNAAGQFCDNEIGYPFMYTGMNPYDISKECDGSVQTTLCYPQTKKISTYLDLPSTRKLLGVDPSIGNFTSCSNSVGMAFSKTLDPLKSSVDYVASLLERNISVLIYHGNYDWICNWVGGERWTLAMEWSGQEEFRAEKLRAWDVDGYFAGRTRSAMGLTFATIEGAGHMVPYDKPVEALAMIQRWLAAQDL